MAWRRDGWKGVRHLHIAKAQRCQGRPLSGLLRKPPLPTSWGEEMPIAEASQDLGSSPPQSGRGGREAAGEGAVRPGSTPGLQQRPDPADECEHQG